MEFNAQCRSCSRLVHYRRKLLDVFPNYHNAPVPAFGGADAPLVIVGLAPGLHGANASGRAFTGDQSGDLLFSALYAAGFSSAVSSVSADDSLCLIDCAITNAVKCVPLQNRPTAREVRLCNRYLSTELKTNSQLKIMVALGTVAHNAVLKVYQLPQTQYRFTHAAEHRVKPDLLLLDSYHCSRYNVNTRRLTASMLRAIFERARDLLDQEDALIA